MKNKIVKQLLGISVATVLFASMPMFVLADTYDVSYGDINITTTGNDLHTVEFTDADGNAQTTQNDTDPIVTGTTTEHTVTINADNGTAEVTIRNLNIDVSDTGSDEYPFVTGKAAIKTTGAGNIDIELDGTNTLESGYRCAGIQKENNGTLTIKDDNPSENDTPDSLTATGGKYGAGIGGGDYKLGSDITIEGGVITATGGVYGAGIGGGYCNNGTVTINGGEVTATGGTDGAGIGGGTGGNGTVTINGGDVTSTGGERGAGVGGGNNGAGTVTINRGDVIATGGIAGAGIGGGRGSTDSSLKVSGSAVVKASGGAEDALRNYGAGAAIGEGGNCGKINNVWSSIEGSYIDIDTTKLEASGSITFYVPGTSAQDMIALNIDENHKPIIGTYIPPINNTTGNREISINNNDSNNDSETATPGYTGITTDMLIRQINGLLKTANGGAVTIDFGRNICLTPELMKALFETGNVAKNCTFTYKGKRYNLYIPVIDTKSDKYIKAMEELKKEDNGKGFAGFMRTKDIFKDLGVTADEIK